MKLLLITILAIIAFGSNAAAQSGIADLVIVNANIHTMDAQRRVASAIAVLNGRIIAVGDDAELKPLIGRSTKIVDAGGKLVMPGFNDAHVHFTNGGFQLSAVDLRTSASPAEFAERIKAFLPKLQKGEWLLGGNWDHENWTPNNLPTRQLIDAVAPDTPVFVDRLDGHMAVANSLALRLAGITKDTKDVPGGVIVRDASGEPTGVLKDAAMGLVERVIPEATLQRQLATAAAATDYAASVGVTSVQDMLAGKSVGIYQLLLNEGKLKTRIYAGAPLADSKRLSDVGIHSAFGSDMLRIGTLKGFADGSLGSTTAWFFEPYADSPTTSGLAGAEIPAMYAEISAADKAGLQVMIHAIGDRANATILDDYERVFAEDGARDRRFRIEHAQHLREQDIPRFGKLGVVASMQPVHLTDDGRWAAKRLGESRLKGTYAFRSLLDSGAHLAFGTDWPVAPLNPLFGLYAAVTRQTTDGKNPSGWIPEQKITLDEAIKAYTSGSAYAEFQDDVKGTLEPGKLADMIILSEDIFKIDPNNIPKVKVIATYVGGREVYSATKQSN